MIVIFMISKEGKPRYLIKGEINILAFGLYNLL